MGRKVRELERQRNSERENKGETETERVYLSKHWGLMGGEPSWSEKNWPKQILSELSLYLLVLLDFSHLKTRFPSKSCLIAMFHNNVVWG